MLAGLSENKALELKKEFGDNIIPTKEQNSWFSILLSQFKSPLIYVLLAVAVISLLLKEFIDASLTAVVLIINVLMGFYQEYNAHKTLVALKKILKPTAMVIRDGIKKIIEARNLVPGDLVVLTAGDRIPADGKLIEGMNLLVNEAILTGEEEAVNKTIAEEINLFMGTTIISGRGIMEVKKIGQQTKMGEIGQSISEIKESKTPLQIKLESFTKNLAQIVLVVCLFIFIIGIISKENILEMFRISIVLSVAAIPEGLPIAITVILALGMKRILHKKGLVKKLLSIETLGSITVICTDKTGTLTEGKMQVIKSNFIDKDKALVALTLNNEQKSSLEIALWDFVKKQGNNPGKILESAKRIYDEPFDSEKKYSLTINKFAKKEIAFITGAPEIVLNFCNVLDNKKNNILFEIEKNAETGLRMIGIAFKEKGNLKEKSKYNWLGFVGVKDPVRKEAREAIKIAQEAGIKVKIITGDYRKTAENVAKNLGFEINSENVMEGKELEAISEKNLKDKIDKIILFTRVTPHQKLKIVRVLQEKGEIVAMTGDGVNDAPALKKADIGVVVNNASDVAKETSDLILLDSNFKTIVAACEEGRLIFSNIKKVVSYVLSNAFVEIILIFGAMILNFPLPLTVVQILWINLICDGPPDILLGFESKEKTLMQEKPQELKHEEILSNKMKFLILLISFSVGLTALLFFWYFNSVKGDLTLARTVVFATVAAASLIYIFAFKSLNKITIKSENLFRNKYLYFGVLYGFILLLAAVYHPFFNKVLHTVPLNIYHWLLVFGVGIFALILIEIYKVLSNKQNIK